MMALLLGLFSTDLLANDMSAVTLVMDILKTNQRRTVNKYFRATIHSEADVTTHLPSNLCFRKSNSAFCIISVTYKDESMKLSGEQVKVFEVFTLTTR